MSSLPKVQTAFPQSGGAEILQLGKAKKAKSSFFNAGIGKPARHPFLVWIELLRIPEKAMPEILGLSPFEYSRLKNDPEGAFHKISPKMVLDFCHQIGVHPANLSPLDPDFKQTLPPAILAANISIIEDERYESSDRALARHAIRIEKERFQESFMHDPEYGRVAEKLDDFFRTRAAFYMSNPEFHHKGDVWSWEAAAAVACDEVTAWREKELDNISMKFARINTALAQGRAILYIEMSKVLGDGGGVRRAQILNLYAKEREKWETHEPKFMKQFLENILNQEVAYDRNHLLTTSFRGAGKASKNKFGFKDAIAADAEVLYDAIEGYIALLVEEKNKWKDDGIGIVVDELKNAREWSEAVGDSCSVKAVTVNRLFANRLLIAEHEGSRFIGAILKPSPSESRKRLKTRIPEPE